MKRTTLLALTLAALLAPSLAAGQINVSFKLPLPPAPPLVVVAPGIQVVPDLDDEVFFHDGFYWARRSDRWFRATHPHAEFVPVEVKVVPPALVKVGPPGHYKRWKHHHEAREERREDRHERREEAREHRHERREERREDLHERREERREDKHERREEKREDKKEKKGKKR
ncbi:MAG: hypothetical protein QM765_40560 [Myxococcales bacterium]